MTPNQLEAKIIKVLDDNHFCVLSTAEGGQPKARYMTLFHDGLRIFLPTNRETQKVDELLKNSHAYVILGFDGKSEWTEQLSIRGKCTLNTDKSLKEKLWNDEFTRWFKSPNDPEYVILEIIPERIEYSDADGKLEVWEGSAMQSIT